MLAQDTQKRQKTPTTGQDVTQQVYHSYIIVIIIVTIQLSCYGDIKITNEAKATVKLQSEVKYSEVAFESSKKN